MREYVLKGNNFPQMVLMLDIDTTCGSDLVVSLLCCVGLPMPHVSTCVGYYHSLVKANSKQRYFIPAPTAVCLQYVIYVTTDGGQVN